VLGDEDSWTKVASDACLSLKTPIWSQISTYLELGGGGGGAGGEGTSRWVEVEADHNLIIMVQITEFRVVMPLSVEEYKIAQMYMVTKMQQQQTSGGADEGVEVLVNEPFENEEFGKGQFTSKIYHLQSKLPSWLAAFAPLNSMLIEEEAWNAYPKCKTGCISFHVPFEDQLLKKCM
jgi:hypothetical protein